MRRILPILTLVCIAFLGVRAGTATSAGGASDGAPHDMRRGATDDAPEGRAVIVPVSDVDWQQLNPARGDQSPQAGTLWGNRTGMVPTGFLAKFVDGFSSPPHLHNVTYRAVVIDGLIHNDDPDAAKMWMPPGSFWTQPAGEVHITAAMGDSCIALVEIDTGPYLVLPTERAFDEGEYPVNVHESNVVWVDPPADVNAPSGLEMAYLWGSPRSGQDLGTFLKIPRGTTVPIGVMDGVFRAVVISGDAVHAQAPDTMLDPGSHVGSEGPAVHRLRARSDDCVLYIRSIGMYRLSE